MAQNLEMYRPFSFFGWIRHHDCALSGPEHTGAEAEEGASEDKEAGIAVVVVGKDGGDVEEVAEAADTESESETQTVGDTATEEADSSKGRVQGGIGIVNVGCAQLTTGAQSVDCIEHART